jgi:hypothetical protein
MLLYATFFASGAKVAGASWVGSAVLKHEAQTSGRQYPGYSAGVFEWDLLDRWAFDIGCLSHDRLQGQHELVMAMYQREVNYPELRRFLELPIGLEDALLFGSQFDGAQQFACQAIDEPRGRCFECILPLRSTCGPLRPHDESGSSEAPCNPPCSATSKECRGTCPHRDRGASFTSIIAWLDVSMKETSICAASSTGKGN